MQDQILVYPFNLSRATNELPHSSISLTLCNLTPDFILPNSSLAGPHNRSKNQLMPLIGDCELRDTIENWKQFR